VLEGWRDEELQDFEDYKDAIFDQQPDWVSADDLEDEQGFITYRELLDKKGGLQ
jgi:hypothetical protein